jgi:nucleoside-diphosphate-sugar epimerase
VVEETVLVTGGCGFIGGRLVADLKAAGHAVRVLDIPRADFTRADALGARCLSGSVVDGESVRTALGTSRVVYHMAGPDVRITDAKFVRKMVVAGAQVLMEEVEDTKVELVVAASLTGFYARSPSTVDEAAPMRRRNELERAKLEMEVALAKGAARAGVRAVALRMGLVYGRGDGCTVDRLLPRMIDPRPLPLPRNGFVNALHVEDAASAAIGIARKRRGLEVGRLEALNCSSGEVLSAEGFAMALATASGTASGRPALKPSILSRGPDEWVKRREGSLRIVDAAPVSIGRIRSILHDWPRWSTLERGLRDVLRDARGVP